MYMSMVPIYLCVICVASTKIKLIATMCTIAILITLQLVNVV